MTHTLSCVSAFACWQFLDLLVTTFLEPVQVKERSLANREGVGGLPEPEPQPWPVMWSGRCAPNLAGPASPGQTGQGTPQAPGALLAACRAGLAGLAAPGAALGVVLREVEAAGEGKAAASPTSVKMCWAPGLHVHLSRWPGRTCSGV